jgi:hypothetical protein
LTYYLCKQKQKKEVEEEFEEAFEQQKAKFGLMWYLLSRVWVVL